jgi:hypothetical protein
MGDREGGGARVIESKDELVRMLIVINIWHIDYNGKILVTSDSTNYTVTPEISFDFIHLPIILSSK